MTRPGLHRPVVIPKKPDLKEDIVLNVARTLGLKRKDVDAWLHPKKAKKKPN
jgi:hypothetical protein